MKDIRTQQRKEALKRMKKLKLHKNVIDEFSKEDKLNVSVLNGMLYWLDDDYKKIVNDFEKEYNAVVYHLIFTPTKFGRMLSLLYVSKHKSEWEIDIENLNENIVFAYIKNLDDDYCSEFGYIGFRQNAGGLIRTDY